MNDSCLNLHSRRNTQLLLGGVASLLLSASPIFAAIESGFTSLFDGKSLAGWTMAGDGVYMVKSGVMVCPQGMHGNFFSDKEFSDFVLRLDFKLQAGGNNGVGIRCPMGAAGEHTTHGTPPSSAASAVTPSAMTC